MKSLKTLPQVIEALSKIARKGASAYDNGTYGMKVKCFLWNIEEMQSEKYRVLTQAIVAKKFSDQDYSTELKQLKELPPAKGMMIFKLVEPMNIRGTKVEYFDGKPIPAEIKGCTEIRIPQSIIDYELLSYEETDEKDVNASGQEVDVVILDLGMCSIDIKEGMRDFRNGNVWIAGAKAYVTEIPFKVMQNVGGLIARTKYKNSKVLNYMSDEQYSSLNG